MSMTVVNNESMLPSWTEEQIQVLKSTVAKGISDDEFKIFGYVCKRTGLDPFIRQIYAIPRYNAGSVAMTMQTGIDGFRLIAERTGKYAPGKEPTYIYDNSGKVNSATAYVRKLTSDGTWHEVAATAFYSEYVQLKKDGNPNQMWATKPHIMLAKCAECLALRKAFPADLSGLYSDDEMGQADNPKSGIQIMPKKDYEPEILEFIGKHEHLDASKIRRFLDEASKYKKLDLSQTIQSYADPTEFQAKFSLWDKQDQRNKNISGTKVQQDPIEIEVMAVA